MTAFPDRPHLMSLHAKEKAAMGEDWYPWLFEVKESPYGDFYQITGAVCPLKTKAKNKGRPNFNLRDKKTIKVVQLGIQEHKDWLVKWEQDNDSCSECFGTGLQWTGWSVDTGDRYKPCKKCDRCPEQGCNDAQLDLEVIA